MDRLIANIVCAFVPSRNSRSKIRAFFGRNKFSPLRPLARFILPRILPVDLHNAIVFELYCGLADQIRTICFAKCVYDNWQGKKPDIIINVGKIFKSSKIGYAPRAFDDPELQDLLKSTKRCYNASGKKLASQAFELNDYKIDWSWVTGFVVLPCSWITKYDLFGRHYVYRAQANNNPFAHEKKITTPVYVRSFPDFDLFESPSAAGFLKSMTVEMKGANATKLVEIKGTHNSVCVHIRRGDYIAKNKGVTLPADYFEKAVASIIEKTGWKNATLFVFSDDWEWTEKAINFHFSDMIKVDFVRLNGISDPIPELELMRACRHFVISAGNFARMAAEMSDSPDKIMIMPTKKDFVRE